MRPPDISALKFEELIEREWLSVNGLGGYAGSTLCGLNTRKYHGLLVAALSPPVRRMVVLSHVDETIITSHGPQLLGCNEYPGAIFPKGHELLRAFSVEPFPRWAYQGSGFTIEKSLRLLEDQNAVCITYTLLAGGPDVTLEVRPLMALRGIHELSYQWNGRLIAENRPNGQVRIAATNRTPEVFFSHDGSFHSESYWYFNFIHRREQERGYSALEDLWNPGSFRWTLAQGQTVHLVCSIEPLQLQAVRNSLDEMDRQLDQRASTELGEGSDENLSLLLQAAHQFIVRPMDSGRGQRTIGIMAQYPWQSPSGRSALQAMSGLLLVPGRFHEAQTLLQDMAAQLQDGLIPTEYSEQNSAAQYTGADTALWFVNAVGEYLTYTGDEKAVRALLPTVEAIITAYQNPTKLGITFDANGLLAVGPSDFATSWMDARFENWIVTPRNGKTVELNALWYNALRIGADLQTSFGKANIAAEWNALAKKIRAAFNDQFWNPQTNCCFDIVTDQGKDPSIRPNQVLAMGLPHPILAAEHHAAALASIEAELLTPMGLRTLSVKDKAYQGHYAGSVAERDRAQHQGSVYPWLLAPFASAYLRLHGRNTEAIYKVRRWLEPCLQYLHDPGIGQLCELFDGDSPHHPGGANASAVNVAEILRCYARDVLGLRPAARPFPGPLRIPPAGVHPATTAPPGNSKGSGGF